MPNGSHYSWGITKMPDVSPEDVLFHWSVLIEDLEASPQGFYESVEAAIQKRKIPEAAVSRFEYFEGGVLSAKRQYLRVTREKLIFDICGAPYGTGFFMSSWLTQSKMSLHPIIIIGVVMLYFMLTGGLIDRMGFFAGIFFSVVLIPIALSVIRWLSQQGTISDDYVRVIPVVGWLYKRFFKPDTYYALDTEIMFQTATHQAVIEAVDGMTGAKGLRALSELERKPVMRDFMKK